MALPTKLVAWTYSINNRITYTSLVQVMQETMFLIVKRLIAVGYTIKGSCNGTTGAMDGVDRWATAADAGTRFAGAAGAQSWFVLTDANGYDICFAFNAATDHVYRFTADFEGGYIVAGTPSHQPTSDNEILLNTFYTTTPGTIINATVSLDRIVQIWTRPDAKGFRVAVARNSAWASAFGVDMHAPAYYAPGVDVSLATGFYMNAPGAQTETAIWGAHETATNAPATQFIVRARRMSNSNITCSRASVFQGANAQTAITTVLGRNFAPELQGGIEYELERMRFKSITTGHRGAVGNAIDWWVGDTVGAGGDGRGYGNREFICISSSCGFYWPWDGTSSVLGTAVAMS